MHPPRPRSVPILLSLMLAGPAAADELRLADGRVLVGSVRSLGEQLEITTRDGVVIVAAAEVTARRSDAELRAELASLAKARDDAFGQVMLARTARDFGLARELWQHLDAAIAQSAAERDSAARRQLDKLLGELEPELLSPEQRGGDPKRRVRALVRTVRDSAGPARCAAAVAVLARIDGADEILRDQARRGDLREQRIAASAALLRRSGDGNDRFVFRRTILDRDVDVRRGVAGEIADAGLAPAAIDYLAAALLDDRPFFRMHTAEAFAAMRDAGAVPYLVAAGPLAGTPSAAAAGGNPGVRAHMFATTQRAYIRDFDVEIAQAAAVANPVIGTVTNGVVLDVTVGAVVAMRTKIAGAYRRALTELVGSDPGEDPAAWDAWYRAQATKPEQGR